MEYRTNNLGQREYHITIILKFFDCFSCFAEFRFLKRLILVHGRYSYNRTAFLSQYSFYKSLLICFIQILWVSTYSVPHFDAFLYCGSWVLSIRLPSNLIFFWCTDIRELSVSLLFQVSLELVFSILSAWWLTMFSTLVFLF